nr:YdbL family protein [uncultured Sphingorhabdus sp.]
MKNSVEMLIAALLLGATATSAVAYQSGRDPAYQSARQTGLVGEKADGYLGFVVPPSAAVRALVEDINIKRKAAYSKEALANGATVEEMALRSGCRLIAERTVAGEKYQTPSGQWMTRDASPPALDPRCP